MEKEILDILKLMQSDMKSVKSELKEVNERLKKVEVQQREDHQILKALEHSAEVYFTRS